MPLNLLLDDSVQSERSTHQLIVIGNGFDLCCGLASSFSSFFEDRKGELRALEDDAFHNIPGWTRRLESKGLNAWDIILEQCASDYKNPLWSDIETSVADWVAPCAAPENVFNPTMNKHLRVMLKYLSDTHPSYRVSTHFSEIEVARYLRYVYGQELQDYATLLDALMKELHKLENAFKEYLLDEIEKTDRYQDKVASVMHGIVFDEIGESRQSDEYAILNFNYTIPNSFFRGETIGLIDHYVNIHGNLYGECIIGIDSTGRMDDVNVAQFTKTFRVMEMGPSVDKGFVYGGPGAVASQTTALIKLFGHSLSEADYSYFQSLFDTVDLYGGETRLIFYYSPHGAEDYESACLASKKSVMAKVINLLSTYGQTLTNADHGKNLIHKLLLEGRLVVKLLPGAKDVWEG